MLFDFNLVFNDMVNAAKNVLEEGAADAGKYAQEILVGEKQTLKELSELRLNGYITDEELKSELEDEKQTVEAQLLALQVIGKATAQKAANTIIDVLVNAIKLAL